MTQNTYCLASLALAMMIVALIALLCCGASQGLTPSPVRSRAVSITPELTLSVYELAQPAQLVHDWSHGAKTASDPFGVVLWPGALFAARRLCMRPDDVSGATCCVVGAGTGLEALTAAALGASQVIACDINRLTLNLLADAARDHGLQDIETRVFDLCSSEPLPAADIYVFADTLYTRELCGHVARRCRDELWCRGVLRRLLLTTSQQFSWIGDEFLELLNEPPLDGQPKPAGRHWRRLEWEHAQLKRFTGSGILLEDDQTYDAAIRFIDVVP